MDFGVTNSLGNLPREGRNGVIMAFSGLGNLLLTGYNKAIRCVLKGEIMLPNPCVSQNRIPKALNPELILHP